MITDKKIASEISKHVLEVNRLLNESIQLVDERCSKVEAVKFRLAVGRVMGELLFVVVNPLYTEHPELAPEGLVILQEG